MTLHKNSIFQKLFILLAVFITFIFSGCESPQALVPNVTEEPPMMETQIPEENLEEVEPIEIIIPKKEAKVEIEKNIPTAISIKEEAQPEKISKFPVKTEDTFKRTEEALIKTPEKEAVKVVSQGTFIGADDSHWAKGNISIIQKDEKYFFSFGDNFSYSSIPDPVIYLGDNSGHDSSTSTGKISIKNGPAELPVPENIDPTKYSKIFLRCRAFSVAVGSAELSSK